MKESQFWAAINELEGYADEATIHELREFLLGEDEADVSAFQQLLERYILELRRRAEDAGTPLNEAEACAVVAAGRSAYNLILKNPHEFHERAWGWEEAILLQEAAREVLGFFQRIPEPQVRGGWIDVSFGSDFTIPSAYEESVERLADLIDESPEWRQWWEQAESPRLFIILDLMKSAELREPPRLHRRHDVVEFSMSIDPQPVRRLRLPGRAKKAGEMAHDDLKHCLERVAGELSLGVIPPLPQADEI